MLTAQRLKGLPQDVARRAADVAQALERQRLDEAERGIIAVCALAPQHPEVLRLLGTVQLLRGQVRDAVASLSRASAERPDDPLIHNALGGAFEALRDYPRALEALRRACDVGADLAPCWFNYARVLFANGEIDAAIAAWSRVLKLAPEHVNARVMRADALNAEGRAAEAETEYRTIVRRHPAKAGLAWWGLATLKPMPLGAADLAPLRRSLQAGAGDDANALATQFALAHTLEKMGDYAEAFATLQRAHARARRREPWNAAEFSRRVDAVLEAFSAPHAASDSPQGSEAIFITSLPRSGSTLTEQILASHSAVEGSAELPHLNQIVMEESERRRLPFPEWVRDTAASRWHVLGQEYLARTAAWRRRRPRFTDKMPGNWLYVGAILAMLPEARVVVVRRDPLETALACQRYYFNGQAYTHDFADLAAYWRDFDRAVRCWRKLYPERVHELHYEQLVAEPEDQIRRVLTFCNLPFEPSCLEFHATARRITTPSAAQVREPMRRDTARAAKYGALLDPLRRALGMEPFQAL